MSNSEDSNEIENKFKIFSSQKMKTNKQTEERRQGEAADTKIFCRTFLFLGGNFKNLPQQLC